VHRALSSPPFLDQELVASALPFLSRNNLRQAGQWLFVMSLGGFHTVSFQWAFLVSKDRRTLAVEKDMARRKLHHHHRDRRGGSELATVMRPRHSLSLREFSVKTPKRQRKPLMARY
jgi:hypothetical protein